MHRKRHPRLRPSVLFSVWNPWFLGGRWDRQTGEPRCGRQPGPGAQQASDPAAHLLRRRGVGQWVLGGEGIEGPWCSQATGNSLALALRLGLIGLKPSGKVDNSSELRELLMEA